MTINEIVEKVLAILDTCENALLVAETVFLVLMNRKLGKIQASQKVASVPESAPVLEAVPVPTVDVKTLRKQALERAQKAVELYFSNNDEK